MRERYRIDKEPDNPARDPLAFRKVKANAIIDRKNANYLGDRINAKKAVLRNFEKEVAELQLRYDTEMVYYKEQIENNTTAIEAFEAQLKEAEGVFDEGTKQCAVCGEFFPIRGGAFTKHIRNCKKLSDELKEEIDTLEVE